MQVEPFLNKLENILDVEHIHKTGELQRRAFSFQLVNHIPTLIDYPVSENEWPSLGFMDIFNDPAKMLINELKSIYLGAKLKDDRLYGIRANYGTGIVASMFGCPVVSFDNSLPTAVHVSKDRIDTILAEGVPPIRSGIMGRALDTVAYFRDTLRPYPKLSKYIGSQMLDIQGTFDNASLIWGSDIYYAFYDEPEKVHRLLDIITQTIIAVIREHRRIDACPLDEHDGDWNYLGGSCPRNDSCINLGRQQYVEFVKPYDKKIIETFGGWIHFCGNANQWWRELLDIPGLRGINPFQGQFYDLFEMFEACKKHHIAIVQWTTPVDIRCQEHIRTGFSRIVGVGSFDEACKLKERLLKYGHIE